MKLPSNIFLYHRFRFVILLSSLLLRNSDCTSLRAAISNIGEGSLLNMSFDLIGLSCYIEIEQQDGTSSDLSAVRKYQKTILPISLTFGRQGGYHTITDRLQMPTRAPRQTSRSPSTLGAIRKKHTRDPVCLARSACRYLQPTGDRMVSTLPTESQRYRENGLSIMYKYFL